MLTDREKTKLIEDTERSLLIGARETDAKALFAGARLIADALEQVAEQIKGLKIVARRNGEG